MLLRITFFSLPVIESLWHYLFTLHCDSCVCLSVRVCQSEEGAIACQVLSRAKLSFLSVITPAYFPEADCLSKSQCNTRRHSHTGRAPDSVSPVRRAVSQGVTGVG